MEERRQYGRISLPLPVRLEAITTDRKKFLDLVTRDISASGTFITTRTSFPEDTLFILDFTFPSNEIQTLKYVESLKGCIGSLVRSTPHGIAIQFSRECQMESLKIL